MALLDVFDSINDLQDSSSRQRKSKKTLWKENSAIDVSSSSRCSSSHSVQDSSSNSVGGGGKANIEEGQIEKI